MLTFECEDLPHRLCSPPPATVELWLHTAFEESIGTAKQLKKFDTQDVKVSLPENVNQTATDVLRVSGR